MINILIVTGKSIESNNANAQCVKQIVNYLKSRNDINVDVLFDQEDDNQPAIAWYQDLSNSFFRVLYWPSTMPRKIHEKIKTIEELLKEKEYACIIAVHRPYECVEAVNIIRRKHPTIKAALYEIDPIANEIDHHLGLGKYLFFLTKVSERKTYKRFDHIFHMRCNMHQFEKKAYQKYTQKSTYLDFPKIEDLGFQACEESKVQYPIKMLYSGIIDSKYRPPFYLIDLLEKVSNELQIQVDFHTKGNCQDILKNASERNPVIASYGYIPKDELNIKISNADFLLNIGNKYSNMLPSKVLEYINTGKPIIHISNQKNDACISYLKKYENALILQESRDIQINKKMLIDFCMDNYGKRIASRKICDLFEENTIEYSGKKIEEYVRGIVQ